MPDTYFAPAGRVSNEELKRQHDLVTSEPLLEAIAESITTRFLILNANRQIIYGNVPRMATGKRHGEAFDCIYAFDGPGGCGTSKACSLCGATQAVVASIGEHRQAIRECRMIVEPLAGRDFEVTATPFEIAGEPFTLVFFESLSKKNPEEVVTAERGSLEPTHQETSIGRILDDLRNSVNVPLETRDTAATIAVDPKLLVYTLSNLVQHVAAAGPVTVWFDESREHRTFIVESQRVIAGDARVRLFDRGKLYTAKLIAERVLGGKVWATFSESDAATFYLGFGVSSPIDPRC